MTGADRSHAERVKRVLALVLGLLGSLAPGPLGPGCSGEGPDEALAVTPEVVNVGVERLTTASIEWLNGTYGAGCVGNSGGWSLRVSGSRTMDSAALTIAKNNSACVLTLTSLVATQTYLASPTLALNSSYAGSMLTFALTNGGAVQFFGNAKLSATTFASSVVLTIVVSDDARAATGSAASTVEMHTVRGTVSGLAGSGLQLLNSGGNATNVAANGTFTFSTLVARGAAYSVTVGTQPSSPAQACAVANGSGTMGAVDVTNVTVACLNSPSAPSGVFASTTPVTSLADFSTYLDGPGTVARFQKPHGVAVDSSGNVYVADTRNNRIRKVSPAGDVTTLAGTSSAGFANGTGIAASFNRPTGVAVDASGNVFVADMGNNCIRKITAAGVVTTFAGSGVGGSTNGTGTSAEFNNPKGVAVDSSGNLYVADTKNQIIRKVTSAGVVSTFAGSGIGGFTDGTGTAAQFSWPTGVAVDSASALVYVADHSNHSIRKITAAGAVTTLAGTGTRTFANGTGTAAGFEYPTGLTVDSSGNVYVVESRGSRIRKITSAAVVTTLAGSGSDGYVEGTGTAARFGKPHGVAVDGSGNLYIGDTLNQRLRKVTSSGVVTTLAGSVSSAVASGAPLYTTHGLAVDSSGNVYVTDMRGMRICKVSSTGATTDLAGSGSPSFADGTGAGASFSRPHDVVIDVSGNVYVADTANNSIRKITAAGVVTTFAGNGTWGYVDATGTAARFRKPHGLVFDGSGNLYVTDTASNMIRKVTTAGVVTTLAGSGPAGNADGTGAGATFSHPQGIAIDASGNLYVADGSHRIRKVTSGGTVTTLAGSTQGYVDGTGSAAQFGALAGIAADASGNVYVVDTGSSVIRKITSGGVVTTFAGAFGSDFANGSPASARFSKPRGIALDASGSLYIGDSGNQRIRKIIMLGPGKLGVGWLPQIDVNGSDIQTFTATATAPGRTTQTCSVSDGSLWCPISSLTSGVMYTVTVTATGATGGVSTASASVTATPD